jgi:glucosamine--fructose-6-phosphate aminotransferase (isomerizing)
MCGIVGAIGAKKSDVVPAALRALKNVEYRGYDSAGIAVLNGHIERVRKVGKVAVLEAALERMHLSGNLAVGHTRWATHGGVTEKNAHPHISNGNVVVVHNGVIENYHELRKELVGHGFVFESETDTEVIAHLVQYYHGYGLELEAAVKKAANRLRGAYAIAVCSLQDTSVMVGTRRGSPLLVAYGDGENFLASDAIAIAHKTNRVSYLEEGDIAVVKADSVKIYNASHKLVNREVVITEHTGENVEKGKYAYFMEKEIFEQPAAIAKTLEGVIAQGISAKLFGAGEADFRRVEAVRFLACGTSSYAGRAAAQWIEEIAGIPVSSEISSEYRYRKSVPNPNELIVTISQSGETADTMEALKRAKEIGHDLTLSICNVKGSSIPRESKYVFYTSAGVEKSVASTKAFTTQLAALFVLALSLAKARGKLTPAQELKCMQLLREMPVSAQKALALESEVRLWAGEIATKRHVLLLGRGTHHPVALEGALKIKEVTYIHAEAYPAGELKHGPIALIDEYMPVIVVAPNDELFDKIRSNISEVRARGARVYVVTDEGSTYEESDGIRVIRVPRHSSLLSPAMHVILMQLLALHIGCLLGRDIDQPRNLAKSVTVE